MWILNKSIHNALDSRSVLMLGYEKNEKYATE